MPRLCSYCDRRIDEKELLLKETIICSCGHLLAIKDTFKVPKRYFNKGDPEEYRAKQKQKRNRINKLKRRQKQRTRGR